MINQTAIFNHFNVTAAKVHQMREETGEGMMTCKATLLREGIEKTLESPCSEKDLRTVIQALLVLLDTRF